MYIARFLSVHVFDFVELTEVLTKMYQMVDLYHVHSFCDTVQAYSLVRKYCTWSEPCNFPT